MKNQKQISPVSCENDSQMIREGLRLPKLLIGTAYKVKNSRLSERQITSLLEMGVKAHDRMSEKQALRILRKMKFNHFNKKVSV